MRVIAMLAAALMLSLGAWLTGIFGASLTAFWAGRQSVGVPVVETETPASKLAWRRVTSSTERWEFLIADQFAASMVGLSDRELPPGVVPTPLDLLWRSLAGVVPFAALLWWAASRAQADLHLRVIHRRPLRTVALCVAVLLCGAIATGLTYYGWMSLRDTFTPRVVIATPNLLESAAIGAVAGLSALVWLPAVIRAFLRLGVRPAEIAALPWCVSCGYDLSARRSNEAAGCPECGARRGAGRSQLDLPRKVEALAWAALIVVGGAAVALSLDLGHVRSRLRGTVATGNGDYIMYWAIDATGTGGAQALTLRFDDGVATLTLKRASAEVVPQGATVRQGGVVELDSTWQSGGGVVTAHHIVTSQVSPGSVQGPRISIGGHRISCVPATWKLPDGRSVIEVAVTGRLIQAGAQ